MPYVHLASPGVDARLAQQRGLLVAEHAGDGHPGQRTLAHRAVGVRRPATARSRAGWPAARAAARTARRPRPACRAREQRPRGVGRVGGVAAGEAREQPGVDRARRELAGRGARAGAVDVVEQPGELGRREVRRDHEARPLAQQRRVPGVLQRPADVLGARVLPDDGRRDRPPRRTLPEHDGLALVGDADGDDLGIRRVPEGRRDDLLGARPDLLRVVLHQARRRVRLAVRRVALGDHTTRLVEQQAARPGRALVDGADEAGHARMVGPGDLVTLPPWTFPVRRCTTPRPCARPTARPSRPTACPAST